jgi:hypothetical protein
MHVCSEDSPGAGHKPPNAVLVELGNRPPGVDAFYEEHLVAHDVSDPCHGTLVEQRLAYGHSRRRDSQRSQAADRLIGGVMVE